jgi:pantoate--beta-alanine ligase
MVRDLDMPLRIEGVATVREPDGLAMSSRNRFLAPAERALAPRLAAMMRDVAEALADGGAPATSVLADAEAALRRDGFRVDYLALVEAESLRPLAAADRPARLIAAARLGTVRLLDNMPVPLISTCVHAGA